ncbi:FadR family transcriptional regulator [Alteromonas sp. 5E99-2]|uniref:FadR/GntR family transcriptional regulator n=1 Tax=Alteromonas sp. 5E99-2 TaxID=2817683 RepID=UPI001A97E44C|nr:FadR/GntR family transcriptional regulator [Alteromonas sp. 5E99-2]MBO1256575.1 FadR family transcriptional regulator [Alteromonas sp. 5E99-2]
MKNRRMYWRVVDQIENLIQIGQYKPGNRLPSERELSETFGVSRPTIREAIIALEAREQVEVKLSSGVYVLEKNNEEFVDISAYELTQARAVVEGEACALAAKLISEEEITLLEQTLIDMDNGINSELADENFHKIIARATHNTAIMLVIEKLWSLRKSSLSIRDAYTNVCNTNDKQRLQEHKDIVEALRKHDPHLARSTMHNHFNRLINSLFDASEAMAMEEAKRAADEKRGLYSLNHLLSNR